MDFFKLKRTELQVWRRLAILPGLSAGTSASAVKHSDGFRSLTRKKAVWSSMILRYLEFVHLYSGLKQRNLEIWLIHSSRPGKPWDFLPCGEPPTWGEDFPVPQKDIVHKAKFLNKWSLGKNRIEKIDLYTDVCQYLSSPYVLVFFFPTQQLHQPVSRPAVGITRHRTRSIGIPAAVPRSPPFSWDFFRWNHLSWDSWFSNKQVCSNCLCLVGALPPRFPVQQAKPWHSRAPTVWVEL